MCNKSSSCGKMIRKWAHDGVPIDIHDTVESSGTTITHATVNVYYLITRIVFAVGITGITIWSIIDFIADGVGGIWIFYITHWGLIINLTYMCSVSILHFKIYESVKDSDDNVNYKSIDELNLRFLWNWTLFWLDLSVSVAVFIIFLFWVLVFDGGYVEPITWNTHGTVGVLIVIEWCTSTWQVTYKGALFLFGICIGWVIFSIIFWAAGLEDVDGNRYIYAVLDWGPAPVTAAIYSAVVCTAIPLFHVLLVAIKNAIMKCWLDSRSIDEKFVFIVTDDSKTTEMV